jgi:hypothetical protein
MSALVLLLLVVGAVCFALAMFGVAGRINLVAAGLLAWVLTALVPALAQPRVARVCV